MQAAAAKPSLSLPSSTAQPASPRIDQHLFSRAPDSPSTHPDIHALRHQLEALQAKCADLQHQQEEQRYNSSQQYASIHQALASSQAELKQLEADAADKDAELARLSDLLSGAAHGTCLAYVRQHDDVACCCCCFRVAECSDKQSTDKQSRQRVAEGSQRKQLARRAQRLRG